MEVKVLENIKISWYGFKSFKVYLSEQELDTLISKLNTKGGMYSMEDLYNCLCSN